MDDFQIPKKHKSIESTSGKENKPASNKGRLSLKSKEKARSEDRFSEVTTDEALAELSKGYVPPNTEKSTGWAMRVFEQWQESHRARENLVPEIFQKSYDCTALSHWLALFVSSRELVTVRSKHLGSMSALQKSNTRLFQVCFLHLWKCLTRLIWSLFVAQVHQVTYSNLVVVFHYPKYPLLFCIMVQVFHHIL